MRTFTICIVLLSVVLAGCGGRAGNRTPQQAWNSLLRGMQNGDEGEISRLTTKNGLDSLKKQTLDESHIEVFMRLGRAWAEYEIRWRKENESDPDTASAFFGPESKEQGVRFIRTEEGWKLDEWMPGK